MDLMTAIGAVSQALEGLKKLKEIQRDFDASAYKLQIAERASSLSDAKLGLLDVRDLLAEKDEEIGRLRQAFAFRGELVEHRGFKYETKESGRPFGMPFCPRCEVAAGRYFRLVKSKGIVEAKCPECRRDFQGFTSFLYPDEA